MPNTFPNYQSNTQDTKNDIPSRADIANASDYNLHDVEILTHQRLLIVHASYLDQAVKTTSSPTFAGATFTVFPITPSSAPTTDYQVANKKYVDDNTTGGAWGSITGTLSDQIDLQTVLDTKVPYTGATSNVDLGIRNLTTTGVGSFDTLALTDTGNSWDNIVFGNQYPTFSTTHTDEDTIYYYFLAPEGKGVGISLYADAGPNWSPSFTILVTDSYIDFESKGTFSISTSDAIGNTADSEHYFLFKTVDDVPELTTVGDCNLKLTSSGGTIDFDDEILSTSGYLLHTATTQNIYHPIIIGLNHTNYPLVSVESHTYGYNTARFGIDTGNCIHTRSGGVFQFGSGINDIYFLSNNKIDIYGDYQPNQTIYWHLRDNKAPAYTLATSGHKYMECVTTNDDESVDFGVPIDAGANAISGGVITGTSLIVNGNADINGTLSMSSNKILDLATPTAATDATTKAYVDGLAVGLSWQSAVIKFCAVGEATQTTGNRYIADTTGGGWTENNIYEWNGAAWDEIVASDTMTVKVTDEGKYYTYNATDAEWKDL